METKRSIKRIQVKKLFGLYDYEIPPRDSKQEIEKFLLLYGANGSGKTTILRLLFHLLAPETGSGHKTWIARTKFKEFAVFFSDGSKVWAKRSRSSLIGTFTMGLKLKGKKVYTIEFKTSSRDYSIRPRSSNEDHQQNNFLNTLKELGLTLYLLSDDRKIQTSNPEINSPSVYAKLSKEEENESPDFVLRNSQQDPEEIQLNLLKNSFDNAERWIRFRAMQDSTQGESGANQVYSNIIKTLVGLQSQEITRKKSNAKKLLKRIVNIEKRQRDFSRFGLTSGFQGKKFEKQIAIATPDQITLIVRILGPYLDGLEAKLNALNNVQSRVSAFVETINSFLIDKSVTFSIAKGFRIKSKSGEQLTPSMLSSGERHLFMLFCNIITALDQQSIFIIDEPEISLNIRWQRQLIDSLMNFTKGTLAQFIFATHSMQILSQHLDNVIQLTKL
jgi:energy-coupling factor transporter ATP-binding protein EcfA2